MSLPSLPASRSTLHDIAAIRPEPPSSESENAPLPREMRMLPPVEGKEAWIFLAGSFLVEMICLGGAFSFSIFQDYLMRDPSSPLPDSSSVTISAIGTLLLAMIYFAPMLIRPIFVRFPRWTRTGSFVAVLLAASSLITASFVRNAPALCVLIGLLHGAGAGIATTTYIMWLPQWFTTRRGLANGIAFAGAGTGGLIFPFIFNYTLERFGFAWTLRIWAAILLTGTGCGLCFVRPRLPVTRETQVERVHGRPTQFWKEYAYIFSPLFALNALLTFFASAGYFAISFYLAPFCSSVGMSSAATSGAVSALNAAGLLGEIVIGYACDRLPYPYLATAIGLVGTSTTFLLLGFARSIVPTIIYSLLFGFAAGSWCATWSSSCLDIAQLRKIPVDGVMLSLTFVRGVAALVGPLIAGSLYQPQFRDISELFGSFGFGTLIQFVGSCMIAIVVLAVFTGVARKKILAGSDVRSIAVPLHHLDL